MYEEAACDGYGCAPANFMFVGISAGRLGALKTRVPFTQDASGRIFQRCLGRLGLSRSDEFSVKPELVNCYVTNLVKARILTKQGLNRLPTIKEIVYWLPMLRDEITQVRPKRVIALGKLVSRWLRKEYPHLVKEVPHPRWYQAHGALAQGSRSFEQMVRDYKVALEHNSLSDSKTK